MRYSRQEILHLIGKEGQEKLKRSTIVIIGLGALGTTAAELLARAGIGNLILIDRDFIELNNLHRQHLFDENSIGKQKSIQAMHELKKINSEINIKAYFDNLDYININELVKGDLILDCTDNLETRFLINEFAINKNIPWIYAACIGSTGYVFNVIPDKVCFKCIFKEAMNLETCETFGILNTISNLIASIQVNEALKILLDKDYEKDLIYFNIWNNNLMKIKVSKNSNCDACNKNFSYINGKKYKSVIRFCGSDRYLIKGNFDLDLLKKRLEKVGKVNSWNNSFNFENMIVFKDKVILKAKDEKEAKSIFSKYVGD